MENETLLIDRETVRSNVDYPQLVEKIEEAYVNEYTGRSHMPVREHIPTGDRSEILSMPAKLSDGSIGIKWVSDFLDNESLPPVMGTVIYNDKDTGEPLAIIDGTELTRIRTGCAAAIGSKHLSKSDPDSIGIIGLGSQSKEVLRFHSVVFDFDTVYVSDIDEQAYDRFAEKFGEEYNIIKCGGEECMEKSDVVSTVTPATSPVLSSVDTNKHINALGADMPQKQEIASDVLCNEMVNLVSDNIEQSKIGGEFSQLIDDGSIDREDIHTMGQIIYDRDLSDQVRSKMTVFDSTGLAIQDVVTARMIYENVDRDECGKFSFF